MSLTPQEREARLALGMSLAFAAIIFPLYRLFPGFECETLYITLVGFIVLLWTGRRLVGVRVGALDERDIAMRYRAGIIAGPMMGIVVMIGTLLLCTIYRIAQAVPNLYLALLVYFSWLAMYLVWSATVIFLYRRGG